MNKKIVLITGILFLTVFSVFSWYEIERQHTKIADFRRQLAHEVLMEDEGRFEECLNLTETELKKLYCIAFTRCELIAADSCNIKDPDKAFQYIKNRIDSEIGHIEPDQYMKPSLCLQAGNTPVNQENKEEL